MEKTAGARFTKKKQRRAFLGRKRKRLLGAMVLVASVFTFYRSNSIAQGRLSELFTWCYKRGKFA